MISADTAAVQLDDPSLAQPKGWRRWFGPVAVAHAQLIRGDILGMANDVAHARPLYDLDRSSFRQLLTASAASRNLPGAMLIDKDRTVLETAQTGIQQAFTTPEPDFLKGVDENEPQIAVFI